MKFLLIIALILVLSIFYEIEPVFQLKKEIQLTVAPDMEKYVDCSDCLTAYREGKKLHIKFKNYPILKGKTTEDKWDEIRHHTSMLGVIVGSSFKDSEMDTCSFEFEYRTGILKSSYSLSITISEYSNIHEKINAAFSYCRAVSDSDFVKAKSYIASEILTTLTTEEVDARLRTFHSMGKITDIKIRKYIHDFTDNKNFLGILLLVTFDNGRLEEVRIGFPYHGPTHIIDIGSSRVTLVDKKTAA